MDGTGNVAARYAVCQNAVRSGSLATDIEVVRSAGAAAVSLWADGVREAGVEETRRLLAAHSLRVSTLMGGLERAMTDGPDAAEERRVADLVELSVAVGAAGVVLPTGPQGDLTIADADRRCMEWFRRMAPLAAARGVRLLLEPVHPLLRWASYVHTLRHASELTGGVDGSGLALDVGHLWWDRQLYADIASLGGFVGTVQVGDVDGDALGQYRYERTQIGDGVLPLAEIVDAIESSGYRGYYENENVVRVPRAERASFLRTDRDRLASLLD